MKTNEIWIDVLNYHGLYKVSNLGRVKSLDRIILAKDGKKYKKKGIFLVPNKNINNGYLVVKLSRNGLVKNHYIHQLIAIAFLNHKPDGTNKIVCDHIDHNKENNFLNNIQLITNRENNSKDKFRMKKSSKFVGVHWHIGSKKWQTSIRINKKKKYLGSFDCEIEASTTYQNALKQL